MSIKKDRPKEDDELSSLSINLDLKGSALEAEEKIAAVLAEAMQKALAQAKKEQAKPSSDES